MATTPASTAEHATPEGNVYVAVLSTRGAAGVLGSMGSIGDASWIRSRYRSASNEESRAPVPEKSRVTPSAVVDLRVELDDDIAADEGERIKQSIAAMVQHS